MNAYRFLRMALCFLFIGCSNPLFQENKAPEELPGAEIVELKDLRKANFSNLSIVDSLGEIGSGCWAGGIDTLGGSKIILNDSVLFESTWWWGSYCGPVTRTKATYVECDSLITLLCGVTEEHPYSKIIVFKKNPVKCSIVVSYTTYVARYIREVKYLRSSSQIQFTVNYTTNGRNISNDTVQIYNLFP